MTVNRRRERQKHQIWRRIGQVNSQIQSLMQVNQTFYNRDSKIQKQRSQRYRLSCYLPNNPIHLRHFFNRNSSKSDLAIKQVKKSTIIHRLGQRHVRSMGVEKRESWTRCKVFLWLICHSKTYKELIKLINYWMN